MPEEQSLIGFHTNGESVKTILSTDNKYRTVNGLEPEKQHREMVIVPCSLKPGFTIDDTSSHFDEIDQPEIRSLLKSGCFVTTEPTGYQDKQNLALLMSFAPGHVYSGRGGILMYGEEGEWKPVTLTLTTQVGNKKYLLDIKGTGTPQGILRMDAERGLIGGIETADLEFKALTATELQHPLRNTGVVPVGVYHGHDERGFGQVIRAIPTTLRPSFKHNPGFEQMNTLSPEETARGLGLELGRYLGFNPPRLGANLQTENAYVVDTRLGQQIIATDFAEIILLHEDTRPMFGLTIALEIICNSLSDDPDVFQHVSNSVIAGLKELRPDLPISEVELNTIQTKEQLIDYFLERYLAKELLQQRRNSNTIVDSTYLRANMDAVSAKFCQEHPAYVIPRELLSYLEEEEKIFKVVNRLESGKDEEVFKSLNYIIEAKKALHTAINDYSITDNNLSDYESMLPIPYYKKR